MVQTRTTHINLRIEPRRRPISLSIQTRAKTTKIIEEHHHKRVRVAAYAAAAVAGAVAVAINSKSLSRDEKTPLHTSPFRGQDWLDDLMSCPNPLQFRCAMGMSKEAFKALVVSLHVKTGLCPTRHVSAAEQLAIFLRMARTGMGNREQQERFQRSGETISKAFHRILNMLVSRSFYSSYIKLPSPDRIPDAIQNSTEFCPWFKDCLGAIDGSLIYSHVSAADAARCRSRKGFLSQNIFAACRFDLFFIYLLCGWEGSAADARVFDDARRKGFNIPAGKYYLGDAGFPVCEGVLVPYRGVRYHLNEWKKAGNQRPKSAKELFNLRHARLRNAIERIFGLVKRRFGILQAAPEYDLGTQARIPAACAALHNFIQLHDPEDPELSLPEDDLTISFHTSVDGVALSSPDPHSQGAYVSPEEKERAEAFRDNLAQRMWEHYVANNPPE